MASKKAVYTLSLGSQVVSMAKFLPAKKGLILAGYQESELAPDPASEAARMAQTRLAVQELTEGLKAKGQEVYLVIGGQIPLIKFVKLPPIGDDQAEEIVEFEAQQNIPFPLEEVAWGYHILERSAGGQQEAMLVAIKHDQLSELNEAVEDAGLVTEMAQSSAQALYNAYRFSHPAEQEPVLLVEIGARATNLIYAQGDSVFARTTTFSGGSVTAAIAKELDLSVAEAEALKVSQGMVSLGGAYEEPNDPQVAAMAKIIRNAMGRLQAEITRTNNHYRGQQGGALPAKIILCGGGVALPYTAEFLQEKSGLPVEFSNSLQAVSLGKGVQADLISSKAHLLGDHVGLALAAQGKGSIKIALLPQKVEARKDLAKRKPNLIAALVCLVVLFGSVAAYHLNAARIYKEATAEMDAPLSELRRYDRSINQVERRIDDLSKVQGEYTSLTNARTQWIEILSALQDLFADPSQWTVDFAPVIDGSPVLDALGDGVEFAEAAQPEGGPPPGQFGPPAEPQIASIRIVGLYRENEQSQALIDSLVEKLQGSEVFAISEFTPEDLRNRVILRLDVPSDEAFASMFQLDLPLAKPISLN
ncbi:MAG: pilus assembly protein PilM [Verrucomicrobiota bacterium]